MAWNKYLGAFRNRKQILEGIKNKIFQKEQVYGSRNTAVLWRVWVQPISKDKSFIFRLSFRQMESFNG